MARKPKKQPRKQPKKKPGEGPRSKPFAELPPALQINKVGRPTTYHESYCEDVIALGAQGKSKAQIAAVLGVSRNTMHRWEQQHEEFRDSIKASQDLALAWWENAGQQNMTRQGFNATAFIFQMKNRFSSDYADRQDHRVGGADGGPIQFEDVGDVSKTELARKILMLVRDAAAEKKDAANG